MRYRVGNADTCFSDTGRLRERSRSQSYSSIRNGFSKFSTIEAGKRAPRVPSTAR